VTDDTLDRIDSAVDAHDKLMRAMAAARPGFATYSPEPTVVKRFAGLDDDDARDLILRRRAGGPFDRPWVGVEPAIPVADYVEVRPPRWYRRLLAHWSSK
jgi:hypothetical protein